MKERPKKNRVDYTGWTIEQHKEYLRTEEVYLNYYSQYDPDSIEEFISQYANEKHRLYGNEAFYVDRYESHQTEFLSLADDYIDKILQKKLFNLQCQWRACLVELPFIDIIADFDYWSSYTVIRSCPFIPPITEEEIELCTRYLKEKIDWSLDRYGDEEHYQTYDRFKNQLFYDEHEGEPEAEALSGWDCVEMPGLYRYFDTYQGTSGLINLPNIRGEKEKEYIKKGSQLAYEERVAAMKAAGTYKTHKWEETDEDGNPIPYIYIPSLSAYNPSQFIEATEDERTKTLFKAYAHSRKLGMNLNYDGMDDDLDFLQAHDEPIRIDAHDDWRIAIRLATYRFKQNKAAEMLPYAYDSYLLEFDDEMDVNEIIANRVANFQYPKEDKYNLHERLMYEKEEFLNGREALTGRRDFDYL